jgi:hypothetical protein
MGQTNMAQFLYCALIWLGLVASAFSEELKITVHSTSGGAMIHARVFAKHMAKYTSENIIVRAMPGASGIVQANYLYNAAPKDGSEIGTIDAKIFVQSITKANTVQFDLAKFGWLGSAVDARQEPYVLWSKVGATELIAGSEGGFAINPISLVNSILRWNMRDVVGYGDQAQAKLAFEKGEINLVAYSLTGIRATSPAWLKDPTILPVIQYGAGIKRHRDLPFVPTVTEFSATDGDRDLIKSYENLLILSRAFAAPPNIPEARLAHLRAIFERTVTDQEYRDDAAKIGVIVSPVSWREAEELVKGMKAIPPDTVARLKQF